MVKEKIIDVVNAKPGIRSLDLITTVATWICNTDNSFQLIQLPVLFDELVRSQILVEYVSHTTGERWYFPQGTILSGEEENE